MKSDERVIERKKDVGFFERRKNLIIDFWGDNDFLTDLMSIFTARDGLYI